MFPRQRWVVIDGRWLLLAYFEERGGAVMTIEIAPELEEMIQQRLDTGKFRDVQDVLAQALRGAAPSGRLIQGKRGGNGADLIAVMQRCPYPDFEFEQPRYVSPVRDVILP